jgi:DNA end-binding protein Ku
MAMAPRASWSGQLKLSLIGIPVRLYNVISSQNETPRHMLHKECLQRVRYQTVCPEHGNIGRDEIVKGYEYEKDRYIVLDEAALETIKLETTKAIELIQFIEAKELDPLFLNTPYYVAPDGRVAEEAFRVIREAMRHVNKIGIGRVVMTSKEHLIALRVQGKGFVLTTMHYAQEVRSATAYFEEIRDGEVEKDQLTLAEQLVESKSAPFDPEHFSDRYQKALLEIVKAKIEGAEPVRALKSEPGKVVNLMEALKKSLAQTSKKPPAASVKTPARKQKKTKLG